MAEWTLEELEEAKLDLPSEVTEDLVEELEGLGAEVTFATAMDHDTGPPDTMLVEFGDAVEEPADVYRVLLLARLRADEIDEEDEFGDVLRLWWD